MKSTTPVLVLVAALAALAGGYLAWQSTITTSEPIALAAGTRLSAPRALPEFTLLTADGKSFAKQDLQGRWHIFYFGYTHCPDVCPSTLFMLDHLLDDVQDLKPAPIVVFVSVDAQRDTPDITDKYAKYFDPRFIGLTGNDTDLQKLTRAMSVAYEFKPDGDSYTVIHSSTLLLVDPQGRLDTIFTTPLKADAIASDLRRIIGND